MGDIILLLFGGIIAAALWLIVFGWELAVAHVVVGIIFCMIIIGIPFSWQHFKFARLSLMPFGSIGSSKNKINLNYNGLHKIHSCFSSFFLILKSGLAQCGHAKCYIKCIIWNN